MNVHVGIGNVYRPSLSPGTPSDRQHFLKHTPDALSKNVGGFGTEQVHSSLSRVHLMAPVCTVVNVSAMVAM